MIVGVVVPVIAAVSAKLLFTIIVSDIPKSVTTCEVVRVSTVLSAFIRM